MTRRTRPVSWIKAALKDFDSFPEGARSICLAALTIAAEGGKADIAKPMHGMGSGVIEIALPFRGCVPGGLCRAAWRGDLGCPAFQKKSTQGTQDAQT